MTDESESGTRIPVTVGILTYNSIKTLAATILSVRDFSEILVCDGGSTDGTRELANSLGCVLIDQGDQFTDAVGRLINMTGVREQMLAAAAYDWMFVLDHDEIATPELVGEVRATVSSDRKYGAFNVPRLYMIGDTVIRCASNYPSYQTRLVHRDAVSGYAGIIHDHPVLNDDEVVGTLNEQMLVPQPPLRELWPKWIGYMRLEEIGKLHLTKSEWIEQVLRPELKMIRWLAYRVAVLRRDCEGPRLPISYELSRMAYELGVVIFTGRRFVGLGKSDARSAWGD